MAVLANAEIHSGGEGERERVLSLMLSQLRGCKEFVVLLSLGHAGVSGHKCQDGTQDIHRDRSADKTPPAADSRLPFIALLRNDSTGMYLLQRRSNTSGEGFNTYA